MFFVYVDYTLDGVPFYVGKGNNARIRNFKRNKKHSNVSNKHGIKRVISLETNDEQEAFKQEKKLIRELHTFIDDHENTLGCNFTLGGEGHSPCESDRHLRSKRAKERWSDPAERRAQAKRLLGKNTGCRRTKKWCEQQSEAMKGNKNPNFGKRLSQETKKKISDSKKGIPSKLRGKKQPIESIKKRQKRINVVTPEGQQIKFVSHNECARWLAIKTNRSPNTVKTWFITRMKTRFDFKIIYDVDD